MRRQYTDEQRAELVGLVRGRRATVVQAAARLGVTTSTAYNWMRSAAKGGSGGGRLGGAMTSSTAPAFVELVRANDRGSMLRVRVSGVEIEVRRGFDGELLRAVVDALRGEPA
jgi:transposase-like protein